MNPISRLRARLATRAAKVDPTVATNAAFVVAIALSALLLVGAGGYGWWSTTLAPAVEVNGGSISKSEAAARSKILSFRYSLAEARIRARVAAGTLSSDEGNAQLQQISSDLEQLSTTATTMMVDALLVRDLAAARSISVDDAAIDAAWEQERSLPELRLFRRISVDVAVNADGEASASAVAKAQATVDAILAKLDAGGDFATIAKAQSDDGYAADGGLVGWSSKEEDPVSDAGYAAAWELTTPGSHTAAIRRATGQFVIFKLEKVQAASMDPTFDQRAKEAEVDLGLYRRMSGELALYDKLSAAVTAELLADTVEQRNVETLTIPSSAAGQADEVLVNHILYSPNDDAQAARTLDPADPAWVAAEAEAKAALAKLQSGADFATLAKGSDDTTSGADGGALPWSPKGTFVKPFEDAIWAPGLKKGDLLGPIKTDFGYHIIQYQGTRTGQRLLLEQLATKLGAVGVDFAAGAKAAVKEFDGMIYEQPGWLARYSIGVDAGNLVWSVAAGKTSALTESGNNLVIVHVSAVEQRPLTPEQRTAITGNGFGVWLDRYRAAARVAIDGAVVQEAGESPTP